MNQEEIKQMIPHRDAMLLVEEAEVANGISYGKYHIKGDEWFLQGHFPGNPIVPGVVLCEMLAQSASVLLPYDKLAGKTPLFCALDKVRFKNRVVPGDTFEAECSIIKEKLPFIFAAGKGYVNGKLCVTANFSFALVKE